jgi:hypothetical protein
LVLWDWSMDGWSLKTSEAHLVNECHCRLSRAPCWLWSISLEHHWVSLES